MADNKVNSGLLEFSEDQKVFVALDAETSEVMKAVTIDGDGVETDIAGGGGVTVEALNVTENGTYSEEGKAYSPVVVEVDNDLSVAIVTATLAQLVPSVTMAAPVAYDDEQTSSGTMYFDNLNTTAKVILYKGRATILVPENYNLVDLSGNIVDDGDNYFIITGDCSFTVDKPIS